jgi:hypothetical protein
MLSAFLGDASQAELPVGIWADPEVKLYAPPRYAVCFSRSDGDHRRGSRPRRDPQRCGRLAHRTRLVAGAPRGWRSRRDRFPSALPRQGVARVARVSHVPLSPPALPFPSPGGPPLLPSNPDGPPPCRSADNVPSPYTEKGNDRELFESSTLRARAIVASLWSRRSPAPRPPPATAAAGRLLLSPVLLGLLVKVVLIAVEDHLARESAGKLGRTTFLHDGKVPVAAVPRHPASEALPTPIRDPPPMNGPPIPLRKRPPSSDLSTSRSADNAPYAYTERGGSLTRPGGRFVAVPHIAQTSRSQGRRAQGREGQGRMRSTIRRGR